MHTLTTVVSTGNLTNQMPGLNCAVWNNDESIVVVTCIVMSAYDRSGLFNPVVCPSGILLRFLFRWFIIDARSNHLKNKNLVLFYYAIYL